jgi:glyoxylase-like metal-dependent hydrolase (beta-lactamase superfamily II)
VILPIALMMAAQVASAPVPAPVPSEPQVIHAVKPRLWLVTGAGGNVTVFAADHGLVLVDDKLAGEPNFAGLVAAVRSVSTLPVLAVFNTHHHRDHVGNNDRFVAAHVMVVGTPQTAEHIEAATPPGTAPTVQYTRDFALILQGGRVEAHHYSPGHTDGDTVVHFPGLKVVATGDLVVRNTPIIDYAGGASLGGWLQALDSILALDWDTAIPGHGDAPMSRADVQLFRRNLATFRDRALAAVRAGTPRDRLIASIRIDDLGWKWTPTSWPTERLDGLLKELRTQGVK